MRILLLHNYYLQSGGEDAVVEQEKALLQSNGHEVRLLSADNNWITGRYAQVASGLNATYSRKSRLRVEAEIHSFGPDIVHVHNFFPLLSPSVYYACGAANVPIVQTLHNYRLACPAGTFLRNDAICEECIAHGLWRSVRYACYRQSHTATAAVAGMLAIHRAIGTWTRRVNCYIALTEFGRKKFASAGLPAAKIVVKPNFLLMDPGIGEHQRDFALFVGRLSPEKGLFTLLGAWGHLHHIPLKLVGCGPFWQQLQDKADRENLRGVEFLGSVPRDQVFHQMNTARFLVFPSLWYEGFPMTIVEAFACGLPVIASRLGAMEELVADGRTGLLFRAGDAEDLASKVAWAWNHPTEMSSMGQKARAEFELNYTAERNYVLLMAIYEQALNGCKRPVSV